MTINKKVCIKLMKTGDNADGDRLKNTIQNSHPYKIPVFTQNETQPVCYADFFINGNFVMMCIPKDIERFMFSKWSIGIYRKTGSICHVKGLMLPKVAQSGHTTGP